MSVDCDVVAGFDDGGDALFPHGVFLQAMEKVEQEET